MKVRLFWFAILAVCMGLNAQEISQVDTVDFGVVFEDQPDSIQVFIKNESTAWRTFSISHVAEFPFYSDTVVRAKFTNKITVPGDSIGIWIVAQPEHNLQHKGSILIETDGIRSQQLIPYKLQGRYSNTYYAATENKKEQVLRMQLKATISAGYVQLSYSGARDEMYSDLDNVNGDVECVYTGRVATFNSRPGATANNFNCEHTFPQGFFSSNLPMRSDIHHLYPTDITSNSQRANLPFGIVSNPTWQVGGSKKNNSTFEPRDFQKGTTARAMMYFVLRYQDYAAHFAGQEAILRQWHDQYPPSQWDRDRNDGIYLLQNNRNPFIDYPQFAERITSLVGNTSEPANPSLFYFDTVTVNFTSSSQTDSMQIFLYNSGNENLSLTQFQLSGNLQFAAGSGIASTIAPKQALGVWVKYSTTQDHSGETMTFNSSLLVPSQQMLYFNSLVPQFSVEENAYEPAIRITSTDIRWEKSENFEWRIIDLSGRVLSQGDSHETTSIPFSNLSNGVYIFNASGSKGGYSGKFIVTNH